MFNSESVEIESKTNDAVIAVLMLTPVIIYAYNQAPLGLGKSVSSFFSLLFAGLFLLVLHYKNYIAVSNDSLILIDARHFKPVLVKYNDISNIKLGVGPLEFLTFTNFIKVTDVDGNIYVIHCVANAREIAEVVYDILRTVNDDVRIR